MKSSDFFYADLIEDLKGKILVRFGSVSKFCMEKNISRQNLSEVFSGHQDISVGLYLRICASLGVVGQGATMTESNVSLRDYLSVDHDTVLKSVLSILLEA